MFKKTLTALALTSSTLFAGSAMADPVYLLATISVTDWEKFGADYGSVAIPAIIDVGGEILVATQEVNVVEGSYDKNWTVVVKFPSEDSAVAFYGSPEYQAVIPHRHAATDTDASVMMLAQQFVPPA